MAREKNLKDKRYEMTKAICEALGYTSFYWSDSNTLEINKKTYIDNNYNGLDYVGTLEDIEWDKSIPTAYHFQGKRYTILSEAVHAMKEHNKTLMFPTICYHPKYRPMAKVREMVKFYMENVLNFKFKEDIHYYGLKGLAFIKTNMFGTEMFNIQIYFDHEWDYEDNDTAFQGSITYPLGDFKWLEKKFKNLDDFIKQISGFVEPICLTENVANCETLTNIAHTQKDYSLTSNQFDLMSNTQYVAQVRNATKRALQEALKNIEKQELLEQK